MKPAILLGLTFVCFASVQATELNIRLGQGGFRDERAPDNTVGGGQLCLDVEFHDPPIGFSLAQEYYTKGPEPKEVYEIERLVIASAFFVQPVSKRWRTDLVIGGGIGGLSIPNGERAVAFQALARACTQAFWRLGIYAEGKYIHSRKNYIDFSEAALIIGISLKLLSWGGVQ